MNRLRAMPRTLLLAFVSMAGIVGMLLLGGIGDVVCFLLTALPLLVGGWYAWRMRGGAADRPAGRRRDAA